MKSIRRGLTLSLLATVPALAAAAGLFLYLYARSRLAAGFDSALAGEAAAIRVIAQREGGGAVEFDFPAADHPEFAAGKRGAYFQVWRADGGVLARSPSLGGRDLPRPADAPGSPAGVFRFGDLTGPDGAGQALRTAACRFVPRTDADDEAGAKAAPADAAPVLTLVLARDRRELDQTLRVLGSSLLAAGLCLAGGVVLSVTLAVRRGLAPLDRLAAEADRIDSGSLHHRFSELGLPRELRPIAVRLNGLLARLGEAFARERRFASAAAHELRTPIAELRSLAEVALRWPDATAAQVNYRDALEIARHMEAMVTALLCIARPAGGAGAPADRAPVDLGELTREVWSAHEQTARARGLAVRCRTQEAVVIDSDRAMLLPLVTNLLANAVAHTPDGGEVECRVERAEAGVGRFVVANTCADLVAEDLEHLFEPFWRKDPARSGGAHCGLGLSLVAAYAAALGASVRAELSPPGWFRVAVTFAGVRAPPDQAPAGAGESRRDPSG